MWVIERVPWPMAQLLRLIKQAWAAKSSCDKNSQCQGDICHTLTTYLSAAPCSICATKPLPLVRSALPFRVRGT